MLPRTPPAGSALTCTSTGFTMVAPYRSTISPTRSRRKGPSVRSRTEQLAALATASARAKRALKPIMGIGLPLILRFSDAAAAVVRVTSLSDNAAESLQNSAPRLRRGSPFDGEIDRADVDVQAEQLQLELLEVERQNAAEHRSLDAEPDPSSLDARADVRRRCAERDDVRSIHDELVDHHFDVHLARR